jgi:hypothetical protein
MNRSPKSARCWEPTKEARTAAEERGPSAGGCGRRARFEETPEDGRSSAKENGGRHEEAMGRRQESRAKKSRPRVRLVLRGPRAALLTTHSADTRLNSQRSHRINSRGAARRKITGDKRHQKEQRGDADEDRWIGSADVE